MISAIILSCALVPASVSQAYQPEIHRTADGVPYVSTGIGFDSRVNLPPFSLRLIFASDTGEYLADVTAEVRRQDGNGTVRIRSTGPWLLIDLPPGRYSVEARSVEGKVSTGAVTLIRGKTTTAKLVWKSP